jgi:hypothetical protein
VPGTNSGMLVVKRVNKIEAESRVIHTAIYTVMGRLYTHPLLMTIYIEGGLFEFIERNQLDGYIAIEPCIDTKGIKRE